MTDTPEPVLDSLRGIGALPQTPVRVGDDILDDLRRRLSHTRWPVDAGNDDEFYGVSRTRLEPLVEYWRDEYDWRRAEREINRFEHYQVEIDGVPVHFMRRGSPRPDAVPLILTHGWPWTFWHWAKVMDPLADPPPGEPAFDVIAPCFPGFGFSTPLPDNPDMTFVQVADLWHTLMRDVLGHERYAVGASDFGSLVSAQLAHKYEEEVIALHLGLPIPLNVFQGDRAWDVTGAASPPADAPDHISAGGWGFARKFAMHVASHMFSSSTLSFGFSDSPVGLLAYLLEKWSRWSDCDGEIENVFSKDDILTHAMIYWVNDAIGTSMRTYANANRYPWTPSHDRTPQIGVPTGITFVGFENPPGVSTEERVAHFQGLPRAAWFHTVHLHAHERGGHFIPWEVPDDWVSDLRETFRGHR